VTRISRLLGLAAASAGLWLFVAALPAFADGGPHVMTVNNGTSGINGDCASCHRAHTAEAADLLTADMPTLCTNCHNGTKATTDVVDGVQYTPSGTAGAYQQSTTVGALRGGGFDYALMGTPARVSVGGSQTITFAGAPTTFTVAWNGGAASGAVTYNVANAAARTQTLTDTENALVAAGAGTSNKYTTSGASNATYGKNPAGAVTTDNVTVAWAKNADGTTNYLQIVVTMQNDLRLASQTLITVVPTGTTVAVADTTQSAVREAGRIGVLASGTATTSTHGGVGNVWGNGAVNSGAGVAGVTLDCAKCHNPHGNGQYRILQTEPGEDWAAPYAVTNAGGVEVADVTPATLTGLQVRNYTVNPSTNGLTTGIVGTPTQGDYWQYKWDPTGTTNFTNFYLGQADMAKGWTGLTPVNKATNGGAAPANSTGLMTAWCIQCHTRYNGYNVDANGLIGGSNAPSLNAQMPADSDFMYKHGTTRVGCEQCHVSHGSNAAMTTNGSVSVQWPDGTGGAGTASETDSRLLKVQNRGTCTLCHDPTGTVTPGTAVGPVPGTIVGLP
jgi:predicted CXXCH cytochrome family protein